MTYCFLSCKLVKFSIFNLSDVNGKSLWRSCSFSGNEPQEKNINFKKTSLITILIVAFCEIFIKLRCNFNLLETIYRQTLWYFSSIWVIYILALTIWWFFHVFVINFLIMINNESLIMSFCGISNISLSVNRSNFTLIFFKAACHANTGAEIKWLGSNPYISRHILRNTSRSINVSFWTYKSWYSSKCFVLQTLFVCM